MDQETKINVPDDLKNWLETPVEQPEEYTVELKQYWFKKGCIDALKGSVDCDLLKLCPEYFIGNNYAITVSKSIENHANSLFPTSRPAPKALPCYKRTTGEFPGDRGNNWESITRAFGGEEALAK